MAKIDLHTHTKVIVPGEPETRNIESVQKYIQILLDNNVGYTAITNHNYFDLEQFNKIEIQKEKTKQKLLIFPGVEINLKFNGKKRHMNIIVSPKEKEKFAEIVKKIYQNNNNKIFDIDEVIKKFNCFKIIYYLDFKSGKTTFDLKTYEKFKQKTKKNPVIADVSNYNSAIVFNSNKIETLIGSDVTDWKNYKKSALKLLDVTFDFDSFEELYLFLNRDESTVWNLIKKKREKKFKNIKIENGPKFNITIYDGVNIIFGGKGTGKTKILEYLEIKLNKEKEKVVHYIAKKTETNFKKEFNKNPELKLHPKIKNQYIFLENVIKEICSYSDKKVDYLNQIMQYFKYKKANKYKYKDIKENNEIAPNEDSEKIKKLVRDISDFYNSLSKWSDNFIKLKEIIIKNLEKAIELFKKEYFKIWKKYWISQMLNKTINIFSSVMLSNKGYVSCPSKIDLFDLWSSRNKLKKNLEKIKEVLNNEKYKFKEFPFPATNIPEKGKVSFVQYFHPFDYKKSGKKEWKGGPKNWKDFAESLKGILEYTNIEIFESIFLERISNFNSIREQQKISWEEFLIKKAQFEFESGVAYEPSTGEQALILLSNKLDDESFDIYLLDEPASYIGSQNISDILIPKIQKLNDLQKKIVIVTHNGNLGLNTMPLNMIYRKYIDNKINDKYKTFYGNILLNEFKDEKKEDSKKFITLVTDNFEGGLKAFEFRKELYEIKNYNNQK